MRRELNREALGELMAELARTAPQEESFRVYLLGGGTAVLAGWRGATLEAGRVEAERFRRWVEGIPAAARARYPPLSKEGVPSTVEQVLSGLERSARAGRAPTP